MTLRYLEMVEKSIKENWDLDALSDYKGQTLKYSDVAKRIAELHILFEAAGVQKCDKIALCGRNSANWAVVFMATLTYGAVIVPILHEFKSDNIHNLVNHSGARLLFVGDNVWENLDENEMMYLDGVFLVNDLSLVFARNEELDQAADDLDGRFQAKYLSGFTPDKIQYHLDEPEELACISYTSGTTSFSKGVMLPYRSFASNVQFVREQIPLKRGDKHVCVLPLAHAYGLTFDFLLEFVVGCHIYFLTRMPSPKVIFQAFKEMKPTLIILVPLYVEKLVKKNIIPMLDEPKMQFMLKLPVLKDVVKKKIRAKLIEVFGGNFSQLVIGGAPLNDETESLLKMVGFPYTVGYGMTECGPLISFAPYDSFKERSCGRQIDRMELKIDSPDPENIPGEIMTRGDNVALGYYKNPKATAEVFDEDGWLHTGDLALMDKEGNVTIKGRSKNMLLGSNGQNVYPEEIEDKYSSLSLVSECIVVSKDSKLVALVHPDYKMAMEQGMNSDDIEKQLEEDRKEINKILPKYSQVAAVKVHAEEFEKTPKRSIKRFLY